MIASDRQRFTEEKANFIRDNQAAYTNRGLTEQFNAVVHAYDEVIELPAWGYHLTASQKYTRLREAIRNARTEFTRPAPILPRDNSPATPGAHHITHITATTAADDIAQADDAVIGRAGRMPRPLEAIPIAAEMEEEAGKITLAPDANTPTAEATPLDLAGEDTSELPVAEASYSAPTNTIQNPTPLVAVDEEL